MMTLYFKVKSKYEVEETVLQNSTISLMPPPQLNDSILIISFRHPLQGKEVLLSRPDQRGNENDQPNPLIL